MVKFHSVLMAGVTITRKIMMYKNKIVMALSAAGLLCASVVHAANGQDSKTATADRQMHVSLTVVSACTLTVDDLNFGTVASNIGSDLDESTNAKVTCTKGVPYDLLVEGDHQYVMKDTTTPDHTVNYTLYTDSARHDTLDDKNSIHIDGASNNGEEQIVPIYGRVQASDLAQAYAGEYSDDVTLVVRY